jgi:hypothetical protein
LIATSGFNEIEAPAAGIAIGAILLVISAVAGGRSLQKAAFSLFAVASLLAALAFLTGAPAETRFRDAPGMSETLMAEHRHAARVAFSVTVLLGVIGIAALRSIREGRALSRKWMVLSLCASLSAVAATGWGVYSGIRVQYAEVRAQYLPVHNNKPDVRKAEPKKEIPKAPRAVPQT